MIATIVVRQIFHRIWSTMDRLAAAMVAVIYSLAMMWLEGMIAYGLALHGYVPDSNMCGNVCQRTAKQSRPKADDEVINTFSARNRDCVIR
jgi:hypothetical protein